MQEAGIIERIWYEMIWKRQVLWKGYGYGKKGYGKKGYGRGRYYRRDMDMVRKDMEEAGEWLDLTTLPPG